MKARQAWRGGSKWGRARGVILVLLGGCFSAAHPHSAFAKPAIKTGATKGKSDASKSNPEPSSAQTSGSASTQPTYFERGRDTYWTFGIGPALYSDTFERTTENSTSEGGDQQPDREPFGNSSFVVNGNFWMLYSFFSDIRVGGAVRYYGEYAAVEDGGDNTTTFGQIVDLAAHGEFLIDDVYQDLGVLFGFRVGPTFLFPSSPGLGDDPNIDGLRLGIFGEPLAGIRWAPLPKIALRFDTGLKFGRIWLYDTSQNVAGIVVATSSHLDQFQVQWGLGLEFTP